MKTIFILTKHRLSYSIINDLWKKAFPTFSVVLCFPILPHTALPPILPEIELYLLSPVLCILIFSLPSYFRFTSIFKSILCSSLLSFMGIALVCHLSPPKWFRVIWLHFLPMCLLLLKVPKIWIQRSLHYWFGFLRKISHNCQIQQLSLSPKPPREFGAPKQALSGGQPLPQRNSSLFLALVWQWRQSPHASPTSLLPLAVCFVCSPRPHQIQNVRVP